MVFCCKIITGSPRQSAGVSPRKKSPTGGIPDVPRSISQLIASLDYDECSVLDSIPEREWRLLSALARKRDEQEERERLADQFRKMWQREKEEREMVEAETLDQYKRYLHQKRQQERSWQEYKQFQKGVEQQMRSGQILDCIRYKEKRSADALAWKHDKKTSEIIDKALEEEARAMLAADRRTRLGQAERWRREVELDDAQRKADDARIRKDAMLRETSQRLAISSALSTWESALVRQEVRALRAMRGAAHAARAARTAARARRLAHERDQRLQRARRVAALTAHLRDAVRGGRGDHV